MSCDARMYPDLATFRQRQESRGPGRTVRLRFVEPTAFGRMMYVDQVSAFRADGFSEALARCPGELEDLGDHLYKFRFRC